MNQKITKYFKNPAELKVKMLDDGRELFPFVITAEVIDRQGDLIDIATMNTDNYAGTVLANHVNDVATVIGKTVELEIREVRGVKSVVAWAEFSRASEYEEMIYDKVKNGFLNAASVGIMLTESPELNRSTGANLLKNTELFEWSVVAIPANPLALRMKGLSDEENNLIANISNAIELPEVVEKAGAELSKENLQRVKDSLDYLENIKTNLEYLANKAKETKDFFADETKCKCSKCETNEQTDLKQAIKELFNFKL